MVAAKVRRSVFAERLARKYFFSPEVLCSPISQASSPGRCCWPLSLIRWGGPSAIRTRTAAKRAFNRPLVPFRQLTFCHLALASMSSAAVIGNVPLAGTTSTGDRPDQFNPDRINLLVTRDTDGPGQAACREPLTERRAETVSSICQHTAETHAGCDHAVDLRQRDRWLGPRGAVLGWHARTLQTRWVARPTLGNEET